MTQDEKDFISEQIKSVHQKIDLMIHPMKEDITEVKTTVKSHSDKIITLEQFKEGHQRDHEKAEKSRRFYWEIIAGSGVIGAFMMWISRTNLP